MRGRFVLCGGRCISVVNTCPATKGKEQAEKKEKFERKILRIPPRKSMRSHERSSAIFILLKVVDIRKILAAKSSYVLEPVLHHRRMYFRGLESQCTAWSVLRTGDIESSKSSRRRWAAFTWYLIGGGVKLNASLPRVRPIGTLRNDLMRLDVEQGIAVSIRCQIFWPTEALRRGDSCRVIGHSIDSTRPISCVELESREESARRYTIK